MPDRRQPDMHPGVAPRNSQPVPLHDPSAHRVSAPAPADRRTRAGFLATLGATSIWAVVNVAISIAVSGPPSARALGVFVGALLVPFLLAALITWLIARQRPETWPFWQLVILALPTFFVLRLLFATVTATG